LAISQGFVVSSRRYEGLHFFKEGQVLRRYMLDGIGKRNGITKEEKRG
jgi:hypothetical protein